MSVFVENFLHNHDEQQRTKTTIDLANFTSQSPQRNALLDVFGSFKLFLVSESQRQGSVSTSWRLYTHSHTFVVRYSLLDAAAPLRQLDRDM